MDSICSRPGGNFAEGVVGRIFSAILTFKHLKEVVSILEEVEFIRGRKRWDPAGSGSEISDLYDYCNVASDREEPSYGDSLMFPDHRISLVLSL